MFTLFGRDGLRLRLDDCKPKLLITNAEKAEIARQIDGVRVIVADDALLAEMAGLPDTFETKTRADDMAVFQYTSGTTPQFPSAVKPTPQSLVTLTFSALSRPAFPPGPLSFRHV